MKSNANSGKWFKLYFAWPLIFTPFFVGMCVIACMMNMQAGAAAIIFSAVYLLVAIMMYVYRIRSFNLNLIQYASSYAQVQKRLLTDMDVPYGIMDMTGNILWMNNRLQELTNRKSNVNIYQVFPSVKSVGIPTEAESVEVHTQLNDRYYRIMLKAVVMPESFTREGESGDNDIDVSVQALYVFDETEIMSMQKRLEAEQMVPVLLYIDNYDEALENLEDVRRSMLTALVDRKVNRYISGFHGIAKKLEKDKYFIILTRANIEAMEKERFSILEDIKTLSIGNNQTITMSIGMALNAESYEAAYERARTAIEMALARGGDQAVVKDGDNITYYGGKVQTTEKNTRVKARVKAHALRELLLSRDKVFIMGHKLSDADAIGAAIGMCRAATFCNRKAYIVLNDIMPSVQRLVDRFKTPDYPEDMFITGEKAMSLMEANSLVIVVDVNRPSYTECPELLQTGSDIVVFDHHRQGKETVENAVLSYVEPYASSACEMVAEMLQYFADGIKLKPAEADALYSGIMVDTNNFLNKTGVRTFEAAAFLRRSGADISRLRKMFREDLMDYRARASAIAGAEIFMDNYAIGICNPEGVDSPTVVGAQAANEMLEIDGIAASFVLTPYEGSINISARSIDEVNVQIIMERMGGGGHLSIAGTQIKGCSAEEAAELLKETIKTMKEEGAI